MWRGAAARASAGALVLLLCATAVSCCGPGRGGARRRSTRKLMPLIFKEHVPNVYENTLGASGLSEGPISRDSSRFQNLVPNYNPDILFRDEEGTGADRLMTERCKERLDTLAISVMNQWPGVRLRVKDAWEEDDTRHSPQSLHYEGRAVDLATSDSDRSKYGMLGRLAVEAGFDWVYYEARSHIHCSVKSESPAMSRLGGCFPGASYVLTPYGRRLVSIIREDDMVAVMDDVTGTVRFSPVILMLHANPNMRTHFLHLRTETGREIRITASHLLMAAPTTKGATIRVVYAGQVNLGDHLLVQRDSVEPSGSTSAHHYSATNKSGSVVLEKVVSVSSVLERGVYAPLTAEGNLIIDGVVVSCYAIIDSQALAHLSFLPVRLFYQIKRFLVLTLESIGIISIANKLEAEILIERNNSTSELFSTKLNVNEPRKLNYIEEQNLLNNENKRTITSEDVFTENEESSIHWYPRILYALAELILPRWLIVS